MYMFQRNTTHKDNCVFTRKPHRLPLPGNLSVLYNVTYTVPQRFKCPLCLHTVQTTDRKLDRGSTKSPNHFWSSQYFWANQQSTLLRTDRVSVSPVAGYLTFIGLSISQLPLQHLFTPTPCLIALYQHSDAIYCSS